MPHLVVSITPEELEAVQRPPFEPLARLRAAVDEAESRLHGLNPEMHDFASACRVGLPSTLTTLAWQCTAAHLRLRYAIEHQLELILDEIDPMSELAVLCDLMPGLLQAAPLPCATLQLPASARVADCEHTTSFIAAFLLDAADAVTGARSLFGASPTVAVAQLLGLEVDVFVPVDEAGQYQLAVDHCLTRVVRDLLSQCEGKPIVSLSRAFTFMSTVVLRLVRTLGAAHIIRTAPGLLQACLAILLLPDFRSNHASVDACERRALVIAMHDYSVSWYHGEPLARRFPVRRGEAAALLDALLRRTVLVCADGVQPTPFYLLAHDLYVTLLRCTTPRPATIPGHTLATARAVASQAHALHCAAADPNPLPFNIVHCLVTAAAETPGDGVLRVASSLGPTADRPLADAIRAMVPRDPRRALVLAKLSVKLYRDSAALADALRVCYEDGRRDDAVDPSAALALARRAHPSIQARYLFHGIGCLPDRAQAVNTLGSSGTCCALTAIGQLHGDTGHRETERRCYARAAARGCLAALWRLAACLPEDIDDAPTARVRLYHAIYVRKCSQPSLYRDVTNERRVCLHCGADTHRRCGGCMSVFLCGPACHAAARAGHRVDCRRLAGELAELAWCSAESPNPCDGKWPDDVGDLVARCGGSDLGDLD